MNTNNVRTQYNSLHTVYTENFTQDEVSNTLFQKMCDSDVANKKVLDVGCGDGVDLAIFETRGAQVFGIDPSIEFIRKARSNCPSGVFIEGVGESIPCESNMFDVVISKWAMQTSTDVPAILLEIERVLKKDGLLILLSKHPFLQFLEKVRDYGHGADYYEQKVVTSNIYAGKITLKEPSHTFGEYLNQTFLKSFQIVAFQEGTEFPASEQFNKDVYPTFFIVKARKM